MWKGRVGLLLPKSQRVTIPNAGQLMRSKPLFQFNLPLPPPPPPPFRTALRHEFKSSWTAFQEKISRVSLSCYYCWFVGEVTETILVVKNKSIFPLWELNSFLCKLFQKNFIVLTTNMSAYSRVCKPRIGLVGCSLKAFQFIQKLRTITTSNKVGKHWLW